MEARYYIKYIHFADFPTKQKYCKNKRKNDDFRGCKTFASYLWK